jgi:hypothetical protein
MTTPTKAELIAQCKAANPTMVENINGVERTLTTEEYNHAAEMWAEMQIQILTGTIPDGILEEQSAQPGGN